MTSSTSIIHDIRNFGAVGDGHTVDTDSIQKAIDHCSTQGGGRVLVPPGVFLSGTLFLRDNVHLELTMGAVLRASPNRSDYNADDLFPQNHVATREHVSGAHFLIGINVSNVTLSGEGTIDGNEEVFRGPLLHPPDHEPVFGPSDWRPGQMILICESSHIRIRNLRLINSPYWHVFLHGCRWVKITGLHIQGDRRTRNGDGIDLDCCRDVTVSDCRIDTSDDCITVRANGKRLLQTEALSEGISVTNCVLRARTCGVRVGVGDGVIRNVAFSNLVIRDAQSGLHIQGKWSPGSPGVEISDLRFDNIIITGRVAFHITAGYAGTKPIRRLFFSNINALCDSCSYIGGSEEVVVEECYFTNIHLRFHGGKTNQIDHPSPYAIYKEAASYSRRAYGNPYAFLIEYAREIVFDRMNLRWEETDGIWVRNIEARDADYCLRDTTLEDPPPFTTAP